MRKHLAVFIGELFKGYESRLFEGIKGEATSRDFLIDVFSNYGVFAENYLHTRGETNVINIPDLKKYDGIIVAPDTLTVEGMYDELYTKIKANCDCPVISVRMDSDEFKSVIVDDKTTIEEIVEHFINEHGCRNIFYMSGTAGMHDAQTRLEGYYEVMKRHNLPVRDTMVFQGNYWTDKAKQCLDWFALDEERPEAIVCANDYMAISLYKELDERGISVPEDIRLSGYDNIIDGQLLSPRLSSADVPAENMGKRAVELMGELLEGKEVPDKTYVKACPIMSGTCGCIKSLDKELPKVSYRNLAFLTDTVESQLSLSGNFENCETVEDVLRNAYMHSKLFGYERIYVCLCDEESEEEAVSGFDYTEKMRLAAILSKKDGFIKCDEVFERTEIVPNRYREDDSVLSVFPLHFRGHCMGYIACAIQNTEYIKIGFILWASALANYLDKIKMFEKNKELLRYREESLLDGLTGLMNRRGFDSFLRKALLRTSEQDLYMISVDMDGLKNINDTKGHATGDEAIKRVSQYLKYVQNDQVGCARMGGDEFFIVALGDEKNAKEICKYIRRMIKNFNLYGEKKYCLSASMGYEKYDPKEGITACINKADEKMYKEKQDKKAAR